MQKARKDLSADKAGELTREISKQLSFVWSQGGGLDSAKTKPIWGAYQSINREADPKEAIQLASPFIQWAYPRVLSETQMEFRLPAEKDAMWTKNDFGIWEPDPRTSEQVAISSLRGVLVPGLAFDRSGARLGYGKGYYDRILSGYLGLKVGVAYSFQLVDEKIPCGATDIRMDFVVTDTEIHQVVHSRGH